MTWTTLRRAGFSLPVAVLLSLVLVGQAMAATWSTPVNIVSSAGGDIVANRLLTIAGSTALVVYGTDHPATGGRNALVLIRRSADGGATWAAPQQLSRTSGDYLSEEGDIAGLDSSVDAVWNEWSHSAFKGQIRYARSTDGGASFTPSVALSALGRVRSPHVARGPNGRVAVSWYNYKSKTAFVRVSTDGGATFGSAQILWSSVGLYYAAVAVGDGVIYAAYAYEDGIHLRRSLDGGVTWSQSARLGGRRTGLRPISLTAEGSTAYLGLNRKASYGRVPSYRRTVDKGATWTGRIDLAVSAYNSWGPTLSLQDGVIRAVFSRCDANACKPRVLYRQSSDGISWTPKERVSPAGWSQEFGVGFTDRIVVGYYLYSQGIQRIAVRTGTP